MAQQPQGSSPHSQQPATGPYPEPVKSNPYPQANLPKIHSDSILPPMRWSTERSLSFRLSHQNLVHFSHLNHMAVASLSTVILFPRLFDSNNSVEIIIVVVV
jgi:hypothetical protein